MTIPKILDDLSACLEYEIESGATDLVVERTILDRLRALGQISTPAAPVTPAQAPAPVRVADPSVGEAMARIVQAVAACTKCSLHETRTRTVPGQGALAPDIFFVGEAPGEDEDLQGQAFVGRAGQLLTKMIQAMGYERSEVFIGNILKCRPPENRKPLPDEMETCLPYLRRQIALLKPRVIIALGAVAVQGLLNLTGITKLRGHWRSFEGIDVMPTFHPAYLLRNPPAKKEVWEDLKAVLRHLGRPIPPVKK